MGNKRVPEVRFEGFNGDWEERKLGEVAQYSNGGSFENEVVINGKYELITLKSVDIDGNLFPSNKFINSEVSTLEKGTLVMILSEQAPGLLGKTSVIPLNNYYVLNQRVASLTPKEETDSNFLSKVINRNGKYFSSRGAGTKVQNISKRNVESLEIFIPKFKEQAQIGNFFKQLDDTIALHQQELTTLKQTKQGFLQKMFPKEGESVPEVRFPGFNGDWEERKIGDIFRITRGQVLSSKEVSKCKTDNYMYPVYSSQTKDNGLLGYYNEYLFDTAITWTTDGANAGTVSFREGKFYSTNVNGVLLSNEGYANKTVAEILNRIAWKYVSKVGNPKLMNNVMKDIQILVPSFQEQIKIGEFLNRIDDTITLHQSELNTLKATKKAFLQKMFV
ncbi:restriction endonuclease subunit S [Bacillus vallismortis]|uniref:restriction endonuclease subunit S n=1 Tax=Bacillus vallismortis TaxID=72361 RepID=UPI002090944B|nr:restriction endonuclease subunit S [Bacillus vallismortis]MCO4851799.1 restriction endonuclease subunit S [Bacillus vallismortis]